MRQVLNKYLLDEGEMQIKHFFAHPLKRGAAMEDGGFWLPLGNPTRMYL